jgi:hypothetical protein
MNLELHSNSKIEIWSTIFQHLEQFTDNVSLMFYSDRLYVQTMDKSHVAVCEVFLPASWFNVYNVHKSIQGTGKYISVGVNVAMLTRILKVLSNRTLLGGEGGNKIRGKEKSVLKMGYEYNSDTLTIAIGISGVEGEVETKIQDYGFELPLVFLADELMNIPTDTDYTAEIRLSSEWMAELVKTLKGFGETVEIQCSEKEIAISVSGIEQGTMRVPIATEKLAFFSIEEGAELDLFVRLKYLYAMSMFHKLSRQIVMRIEKERPIQLVYSLEGVGGSGGSVVGSVGAVEDTEKNGGEEGDDGADGEEEVEEKDPDARLVFYLVQCEEP